MELHTIFNIRRLFESRNLYKGEAVSCQIFIGHANACLKPLFRVCKFFSLRIRQQIAKQTIQTADYPLDNEFEWHTVCS